MVLLVRGGKVDSRRTWRSGGRNELYWNRMQRNDTGRNKNEMAWNLGYDKNWKEKKALD